MGSLQKDKAAEAIGSEWECLQEETCLVEDPIVERGGIFHRSADGIAERRVSPCHDSLEIWVMIECKLLRDTKWAVISYRCFQVRDTSDLQNPMTSTAAEPSLLHCLPYQQQLSPGEAAYEDSISLG